MIDNFAIYSSCIAVIYIIWRAALLDGLLPWYKAIRPEDLDGEKATGWRARLRGDAQGDVSVDPSARPEAEDPRPVWRRR